MAGHRRAALESYVRNVLTARDARRAAQDSPFTTGSQGQLVPHPGLRVADTAEAAAHKYATALLLTPEARKRHNITSEEAHAFPYGIIEGVGSGGGRLGG